MKTFIEEKVSELKQLPVAAVLNIRHGEQLESFLRQSLKDAYITGSMQGYKEGLHGKKFVKKVVEHLVHSS